MIYKGFKYIINKCKVFRIKSIEDCKYILCDYNICFCCCEILDYFVNCCKVRILCDVCKSNYYCIVFYEDVSYC